MSTISTQGRALVDKLGQLMSDRSFVVVSGHDRVTALHRLITEHDNAVNEFYRQRQLAYTDHAAEEVRLVRAASERTLADYLQRLTAAEAELAALKKG